MPASDPRHASRAGATRPSLSRWALPAVLALAVVFVAGWIAVIEARDDDGVEPDASQPAATGGPSAPTPTPLPTPTAGPTPTPYPGWVDPASSGEPWDTEVDGLLTFRGNPTRSYHGSGPVPSSPRVRWRYPSAGELCGQTRVGGESVRWCGLGWTGQPAVFEREGRTWVVFGAYDHAVHFVDADSGEAILPPFPTGDIVKGSVTVDPDGYPLVYTGSRDDFLRVLAFDREEPVELWSLDGNSLPGKLWNDDWDGSPLVIDDYLFQGGENSLFHIVKLNRSYDESGLAVVDPELVFVAPGYDDELVAAVGENVSIEGSVAISGDTVYFANSGGLVQGWDIAGLAEGETPERVFRYWVGDDVDATVVVDEEGMLYVGVEYERGLSRSLEVGQLVKLDPSAPDDPMVWSVLDAGELPGGVWATPALHRDLVIVPTNSGRVIGVDRVSGDIRWELWLPGWLWSSPVVVDDVYLQGDCAGRIHAFDVSDTSVRPPELWSVEVGGCIEATPAVWEGRILIGTWTGHMQMLAD